MTIALLAGLAAGSATAQQKSFSIGTASVTGVYYPAGRAICRLVNKSNEEHRLYCTAEITGGSISNINSIRAGELAFGVAQSDWQYHAYNGSSKFTDRGRFEKLRAVFSIHPEPVTILARDDSGIEGIADLKGKRINIGNPGSGARGTWDVIEGAMGWSRNDLKLAPELSSTEATPALCDNKIDGFFSVVGHPSALTLESLWSCAVHLVNATGPEIDKLVRDNPFYRKAVIPAGMYDNKADVTTFGVGATFVTSADVPEEMVYQVVKAVFENLGRFKKLHPAFANLKPQEMIEDSLSAPIHPGAEKYYREMGWK